MINKNINNIIREVCQVANIAITKAGNGESLNPAELVALTQILDNWKDSLNTIRKEIHQNEIQSKI